MTGDSIEGLYQGTMHEDRFCSEVKAVNGVRATSSCRCSQQPQSLPPRNDNRTAGPHQLGILLGACYKGHLTALCRPRQQSFDDRGESALPQWQPDAEHQEQQRYKPTRKEDAWCSPMDYISADGLIDGLMKLTQGKRVGQACKLRRACAPRRLMQNGCNIHLKPSVT